MKKNINTKNKKKKPVTNIIVLNYTLLQNISAKLRGL